MIFFFVFILILQIIRISDASDVESTTSSVKPVSSDNELLDSGEITLPVLYLQDKSKKLNKDTKHTHLKNSDVRSNVWTPSKETKDSSTSNSFIEKKSDGPDKSKKDVKKSPDEVDDSGKDKKSNNGSHDKVVKSVDSTITTKDTLSSISNQTNKSDHVNGGKDAILSTATSITENSTNLKTATKVNQITELITKVIKSDQDTVTSKLVSSGHVSSTPITVKNDQKNHSSGVDTNEIVPDNTDPAFLTNNNILKSNSVNDVKKDGPTTISNTLSKAGKRPFPVFDDSPEKSDTIDDKKGAFGDSKDIDNDVSSSKEKYKNMIKLRQQEGSTRHEKGSFHFVAFLLLALILALVCYVAFQKRNKIMGYIVEGKQCARRSRNSGSRYTTIPYSKLSAGDKEAGAEDIKYVY